jgi:hypothetical protein
MVKYAYVSFIDKPVDKNMQCTLHNKDNPLHKHCGAIVRKGMQILVDATECKLVGGYILYGSKSAYYDGNEGLQSWDSEVLV